MRKREYTRVVNLMKKGFDPINDELLDFIILMADGDTHEVDAKGEKKQMSVGFEVSYYQIMRLCLKLGFDYGIRIAKQRQYASEHRETELERAKKYYRDNRERILDKKRKDGLDKIWLEKYGTRFREQGDSEAGKQEAEVHGAEEMGTGYGYRQAASPTEGQAELHD